MPTPVSDSTVGELAALLVNDSDPETVALAVGLKATLYDTLCPAGIVNGKVAPSRTNCELLLASADTVTLAPLALMLMACVPVAPTLTSPKLTDEGVMLNFPAVVVVVPVPLSGTLNLGLFEELLVNDNEPETTPLAVGLKATLYDRLFPAGIVNGNVAPCKANCEALLLSADTVTLAPLALIVIGCVPVEPTFISPKFTDVGVMLNWPAAVVVAPVPLKGTVTLGPVTKSSPALAPEVCGAKVRFTVRLCPGFNVTGKVAPLTENSLPVIWNA